MRVRGVATLTTMAFTAVFALVGCSDTPEPSTLNSSKGQQSEPKDEEPTPTPTDEENSDEEGRVEVGPDEKAPTGPEAAQAEQFVEKYMAEENKAYGTGDVSKLEEMAGPDCLDCNETIAWISKTYGDGGRLEGYQIDEPDIGLRPGRLGDGYLVKVTGERAAWQVYDSSGKPDPEQQGPAEQSNVTFTVENVDGEWQIVGG